MPRLGFGLITYLAFGFTFQVLFNSSRIDPYDAWMWAWIFGWPIIIGFWMMKWMLVVVGVIIAIAGLVAWRESRL